MPSVVFLHPVGLDGQSFQFLSSERLRNANRYNLLWHGGREEPAQRLSIEAMAEDVVAQTDGALDLVGVSMGGQVAQRIAMRHPSRVRSLFITSGINDPIATTATTPISDERAEMVLRVGIEGVLDWALQRWFTDKAVAEESHPGVIYVKERLRNDTPEQFAAGWNALANKGSSREEQAAKLTMPTTILHPENDHTTLESCAALAALIPHGRLRECRGPHMVHLEEPGVFEDLLLEHLDWVENEPAAL